MKPERWRQIDKLLDDALDKKASQREAFVAEACGDDEELRDKLETLLESYARAEGFIEGSALEVAARKIVKHHDLVGRQIGSYQITSSLGEGGMGEVYQATDTKLEREVAIKVLPDAFAQDPQRFARFEREAKLLASLNHPNIAAIYDLQQHDRMHYLVLELVTGKTLAEHSKAGPLLMKEALELGCQVAEALEAAHAQGIVHRDLKPENIKLTSEDKIKLLDFGLAKAYEKDGAISGGKSPVITEGKGIVLGTAAYMSPEQARGKEVDERADIWSFGCVLYEMLAGKRAFEGGTVSDTLALVLEREPHWEALPEGIPSPLRTLLQRCLEKDPRRRLHAIADVRIEIEDALSSPMKDLPTEGTIATTATSGWRRLIPLSVVAVIAIIAGVTIWNLTRPAPMPLTKFVIMPPPSAPFANTNTLDLAISPDGRIIVYLTESQGRSKLFLRHLDELAGKPIAGTEGAAGFPFFSPDGQSLGFHADGKLKRVSLAGGALMTLCEAELPWFGGTWAQDSVVFSAGRKLYRVADTGGEPESLAVPDKDKGESEFSCPKPVPGGKAVFFDVANKDYKSQIRLLSLETGKQTIVVDEGINAHYTPTGHLVYQQKQRSTLMAAPFDLTGLKVTGDAVPVLEGIRAVDATLSSDGTLIYVPIIHIPLEVALIWVDRNGTQLEVIDEKRSWAPRQISPDGNRIALIHVENNQRNIWIHDLQDGSFRRLTFEGKTNEGPIWTPDGKWITFASDRDGPLNLYRRLADGSRPAERLTTSEFSQSLPSWSPDGSVLAFSQASPNYKGSDIWVLPMKGDRKPRPFITSSNNDIQPRFSPDGRWLAYGSSARRENGQVGRSRTIYVRPYPGPDVKWLVSGDEGGLNPVWSPDGIELFYHSGDLDKIMVVPIQTQPTFRAGKPRVLFEGRYGATFDISPDGKRFLMSKLKKPVKVPPKQINVVLNWFEELKRRVPKG